MQENLNSCNLTQLREMAKELGIRSVSSYRKSELIGLIEEKRGQQTEAKNSIQNSEETKISQNPEAKNNIQNSEEKKTSHNPETKNSIQNSEETKISQNSETEKRSKISKEDIFKPIPEFVADISQSKKESPVKEAENANVRETKEDPAAHDNNGRIAKKRDNSSSFTRNGAVQSRTRSFQARDNHTRSYSGSENRSRNNQNENNADRSRQNGNNSRGYQAENNSRSYQGENNSRGYQAENNSRSYQGENNSRNYQSEYNNRNNQSENTDRAYQNDYNERNNRSDFEENYASLENGRLADGFFELIEKEENGEKKEFGFIRCDNYLSGTNDIYVGSTQIRKFSMRTGDRVTGTVRSALAGSRWDALLRVTSINGENPEKAKNRPHFEKLTPIFPNQRIRLETPGCSNAIRIMDLFAPIGKGQRGMIVSPPKAGKTTLLKDVANAVIKNYPDMHIIILLIDERPEEVTDIKDTIEEKYDHVEVIYSTFDETPEHHKNVAELVLERGKRMVEQGQDVIILLDSITRLTRAYNITVTPSGRTLSGGLDPAALTPPKKFFGAARNMREGGSLTILATALVDTGSRMDDVVFEEFKGTGNMEIVLDRKLSERRIFPAIDLAKSSTRRDDLLLNEHEQETMDYLRKQLSGMKAEEAAERILTMVSGTKENKILVERIRKLGIYTTAIVRGASSGKKADETN